MQDAGEKVIEDFVRQAAQFATAPWGRQERRVDRRIPFPCLIPFTPMCDQGQRPTGPTRQVVGRNLAARGLDFFHCDPLPERFAVVSLPCAQDQWVHFLLRITWCRFLRAGWYDSGGRFVRLVPGNPRTEIAADLTTGNLSYALDEPTISRFNP